MNSASSNSWSIPGSDGESIFGNTHLPLNTPVGVILLCHGFKGYKDYGLFPYLAQCLAEAGLIVHRFNFSHSGMTHQTETFERPDLFEKDTWGKQIADIRHVAHAVQDQTLGGQGLPMVLFGHSRGGLSVLMAATHQSFAGVVTAAAVNQPCNLLEEHVAILKEDGFIVSPSGRTGQQLRIGLAWLEEIESDPDSVDPMLGIAELTCPVLLIHGQDDQAVPVQCCRALAKRGGDLVTAHEIAEASHVFNAPNPMDLNDVPPATAELVSLTCAFAVRVCG